MKIFLYILLGLGSLYADQKNGRNEFKLQKHEKASKPHLQSREKSPHREGKQHSIQKGAQRTPSVYHPHTLNKPQYKAHRNKPPQKENFKDVVKKWGNEHKNSVEQLKNRVNRRRPNSKNWFSNDFFNQHSHSRHGFNRSHANWWRPARWAAVSRWVPYGWSDPIYYDDGGSPIILTNYYDTDSGYNDTDAIAVDDWLPLGVFAMGKNQQEAGFSNFYVQLAVSKAGEITGTFYNEAMDQTYAIAGQVDPQTQKSAFKLTDDPYSPMMVTGLYNLTQEVAPVQFYFPDGTVQMWSFVRLEENEN